MLTGQDDLKSFGKCYDKAVVNDVHKPFYGVHQAPFYSGGGGADCLVLIREVKSEYTSNMNSVNS